MTGAPSTAATVAAVDDAAFAAAMAAFVIPPGSKIAIAVSGGSDSMALLLLLRAWSVGRDAALTVLTVDHRLRDESSTEAAQVATWCNHLGVSHVVLPWLTGTAHRVLTRSPQAAAREARYELLAGWCRTHEHAYLCVAHHADDQIETFFMRLSRGSGVDGLSAMAAESRRGGVAVLRPLLDITKQALRATCLAKGQAWIEDPSNHSGKSTRVRFRQARALLAAEGFDEPRILLTVKHLQRARKALESAVDGLLQRACQWDAWGAAHLDLAEFVAAPAEISLRALSRVLMLASGSNYGPRFERLARLHRSMSTGPWRDATLHGCIIVREGAGVLVSREAAAIDEEVAVDAGESVLWDGRFRIQIPAGASHRFVARRLTAAAWKTAVAAGDVPAIHPAIRNSLPMLTDEGGLAAIPAVAYIRADLRKIVKAPILWGFSPRFADMGRDQDDVAEITP